MSLTDKIDKAKSLQDLEGVWPEPSRDSTGLVKSIHLLRKRPIGALASDEIARLLAQNIGLEWLMPLAVQILRDTIPATTDNWWYDNELLHAVITRDRSYWVRLPELARFMGETIKMLPEVSEYLRDDIDAFGRNIPPDSK